MFGIRERGLFFITIAILGFSGLAFAQEPSLDLEPIIISKAGVHLLNSYTVEGEKLRDFSGSAIEALSVLPLDLQSRSLKGGIQTDFSLRGSTYQGVLLLVNGQRINDPQTGHHNSDIPFTSEDIERIEVIPGVSSSLFGPDAIAGAINIILKEPSKRKVVGELSAGQYQSKAARFSIEDKKGKAGVRFSIERQESDGFRYDTDFKEFTTSLSSSYDIPDGKFFANLGYQDKEFGAYDFYTPASGYPSKEWTQTYLIDTGLDLNKGDLTIKSTLLWRRHFDKFMLDKTELRSRYLNHHRTDLLTPAIYFQKKSDSLGKTGLGLEYGQERLDSTNLGKDVRSHKSVFIDNAKELDCGLSIGSSFRVDDYDGFAEALSGSLSLRYMLRPRNSLHLGVSRSVRVPCFTELYYNDPITSGNPGLCPENALSYQAGYNYKRKGLAAGVVFFLRQEEDMIDWVKQQPSQAKWQAENITEDEVKGAEGYLKIDLTQRLSLSSNYTYIDKRVNDRGYLYKYGENYCRHLINADLTVKLPFGTQTVSAAYKKRPQRDGWFLLNTCFSYGLNKNSRLFLKIDNLLNVEYQEIEGIPQPGRWVEAGLRFEW